MKKENKGNSIQIKGAKVHNLKNIDVTIPHNQLVVITGLSGSGKSTLAFDTIFAEGQRRYVESLSAYARQFLGRVDKPDVESITGIAPAIAIEQRVNTRNPRSTVGTSTEIYDYIKLLFARIGKTFSPVSGQEVKIYYASDVVEFISTLRDGVRIMITAPLKLDINQGVIEKLMTLIKDGLQRVYVNGETHLIEDYLPMIGDTTPDVNSIHIVVDRTKASNDEEQLSRISDSVSRAMKLGDDVCSVVWSDDDGVSNIREFSSSFQIDGIEFQEPSEHLFSFNNPLGACPTCEGYGKTTGIDEELVVLDKTKSIYDNAIACWRGETMKAWKDQLIMNSSKFEFPIHRPYYDLTADQRQLIWRGNEFFNGLDDFFKFLEGERYKIQYRVMLSRYTGKTICPECCGSRLRKEATYIKVQGLGVGDIVKMPVEDLLKVVENFELDSYDSKTAERILIEITNRLQYLIDVGLGYLTLDRLSSTLSGGESQRINLSTSLGSNLVGSLYILDEPSIGLHPKDTNRLIKVLKNLRDIGNTVIVVEHEEEIIREADQIIDIGPEAGYNGGEVVFSGNIKDLIKSGNTLTSDYLCGRKVVCKERVVRQSKGSISVIGARENNLKGINATFPLGVMTCVTGVSGSGKSTLVKGILYPAIRRVLYETGAKPGSFDQLKGDVNSLKSIEMVDQNPIGKSSRSNPVTYIKAYDDIRKLYSEQPYAKHNLITPSNFSFNIEGGRCNECQGDGVIKIGMQFMADVELKCESCNGRRFKDEILEVKYRAKSIYDILELSVDEAITFFSKGTESVCSKIIEKLKSLQDVGLGYIKLGQSSSTLSGGESQRVKLASFSLKDRSNGDTMFIFDEPTTGLHFHDITKLLKSFNALLAKGHTIIVVEHNMDVIACSDWVIDIGPEGGDKGGSIMFEGSPQDLAKCEDSFTGQFLAKRNKA